MYFSHLLVTKAIAVLIFVCIGFHSLLSFVLLFWFSFHSFHSLFSKQTSECDMIGDHCGGRTTAAKKNFVKVLINRIFFESCVQAMWKEVFCAHPRSTSLKAVMSR